MLTKILLVLATFYILSLFVFPLAILFDSTNTRTLTLSFSRSGIPREDYKYFLFLGGTNWPITTDIAPDPKNPAIVYQATEQGIFKTENNGELWQSRSNDLPDKSYVTVRKEVTKVNRLMFDPNDSTRIYADVAGPNLTNLYYVSSNEGENWEPTDINIFNDTPNNINPNLQSVRKGSATTKDPINHNFVYKVETERIYKSEDNGRTWEKIYGSKVKNPIKHNPIFYPAFFTYFFFAWVSPSGALLNYTGIDFDRYFTTPLVFSPQNPDVVYVGSSGGVLIGKIQH